MARLRCGQTKNAFTDEDAGCPLYERASGAIEKNYCGLSRALSRLAVEVGPDPRPVLIAPGLFGLGDQVLRNAAMRQHELRPTICCWRQRDRGHREDALGECAVAPGLNDAPSGDEVDIDPGDVAF